MHTIRLRTIEGRRMRDPTQPKRPVIATGTVFDASIHNIHWLRRLRDGDVEEVLRKARVAKGRTVTLPAEQEGAEPRQLKEGTVAEISALDDHWRLALERGDAELVPEPEEKKPVSAAAPAAAANGASKE